MEIRLRGRTAATGDRAPAGEYRMTVTVRVDDFGVVHIGGVGLGPYVMSATDAVLRRPGRRSRS
jgi:hypothetical protein